MVILILYFLSLGPVLMMNPKAFISPKYDFVSKAYTPWFWTYNETPLQKPLGMYLHFCVPMCFDKNGNELPAFAIEPGNGAQEPL